MYIAAKAASGSTGLSGLFLSYERMPDHLFLSGQEYVGCPGWTKITDPLAAGSAEHGSSYAMAGPVPMPGSRNKSGGSVAIVKVFQVSKAAGRAAQLSGDCCAPEEAVTAR